MPLLENELARREESAVLLRSQPMRVRWHLEGLGASDSLDLACRFTASVQTIPDQLERRMLAEVLMAGRGGVTAGDVADHFLPALASAANRTAARFPVGAWMEADVAAREAMVSALRAAAMSVAFTCGLNFLPPFELEFSSSAYEQNRLRALHQAVLERRAAEELEGVQRAGKLLQQFQSLRASLPDLSAGKVLEQVAPLDRGSTLRTLLLAGSQDVENRPLWAVAGPYLVRIDPGPSSIAPALISLPEKLGPLRSVQSVKINNTDSLLVGAQSGVMLLEANKPENIRLYSLPGFNSQLGFNQVIFVAQRNALCASHAEAGVVIWDLERTESPRAVFCSAELTESEPSGAAANARIQVDAVRDRAVSMTGMPAAPVGPRYLHALPDGSLVFSVRNRIFRWDGERRTSIGLPSSAEVIGIVPSGSNTLTVVSEDGTISLIKRDAPDQVQSSQRRGSHLRAAGALPWLDGMRLLLVTDNGPLQCVGLEDGLVMEYFSSYSGYRFVGASRAWIAGVTADRQRLVLWKSWEPKQPASELYLMSLTRHRIADIDLA